MPMIAVDASSYRERRLCTELYQRSAIGPAFYAAGCGLLMGLGGYSWPAAVLHAVALPAFVLMLWLRRRHRVPDNGSLAAWQRHHWLLIHAGCLLWSLVLARTGSLEGGSSTAMLTGLLCTVAYGTAISEALGLMPLQALVSLALLLLPACAWLLTLAPLRPLAVTLLIYGLYLLLALLRSARGFAAQLEGEQQLRESRAVIERLTREDDLTGLPNRRDYELRVAEAWQRARRVDAPMCLVAADLDHFKRVNDHYGHAAGDACLRHFAQLLREHFRRAGDHPARIGGEEFVVLMLDCELAEAQAHAEQFRAHVEASSCTHEGQRIALTVSLGLGRADLTRDADPPRWLQRVDAACYAAKHAGRNQLQLG
ncbi:GGDEF domain-containing protein [Roseateles sp. NT4]|uniref:GGDEF domain-containing protein n=1 Tax=Roseateles sp. NT4 TaxID=3453715 RepID=UPI003EEECE63